MMRSWNKKLSVEFKGWIPRRLEVDLRRFVSEGDEVTWGNFQVWGMGGERCLSG